MRGLGNERGVGDDLVTPPARSLAPASAVPGPRTAVPTVAPTAPRRAEVDAKHDQVARWLRDTGLEAVFLSAPANVAWFCGGAQFAGVFAPGEEPCVWLDLSRRWIVGANVDSQRLFDEELDGLGFSLKEYALERGRERLLADLTRNKKFGCDRSMSGAIIIGDELAQWRKVLQANEQQRLRQVGTLVNLALESAARIVNLGDSEHAVAGLIAQRLWHRGAEPVSIQVAADGRAAKYPRFGVTGATIRRSCVLQATAKWGGLHATASRTIWFGAPSDAERNNFETACLLTAAAIAGCRARVAARAVVSSLRPVWQAAGADQDAALTRCGWLTGYRPAEALFTAQGGERLQAGMACVWAAQVRGAVACDTVLVTDTGTKTITEIERWPTQIVKVHGLTIRRPDMLIRPAGPALA
jgi:Xaa-Pro aminopeptidase